MRRIPPQSPPPPRQSSRLETQGSSPPAESAVRLVSRRAVLAGAPAAAFAAETLRLPKPIRIGLVGLDGHTGEILNPLPRLPDVELVAVADPKPEALARFARRKRMAEVRQFADHRRMLDDVPLDLVGVCTPNGNRAEAVLACLERGLHVAAEKPLALSAGDLRRIRAALDHGSSRLTMLLPMRFSSSYLALKQVVDSGEIGEVCQIASQKSYKAGKRPEWMRNKASYGGTIPWIGIHMIDLMRWASGREFTEVFSHTSHIAFPDLGAMENVTASVFQLDNGGAAVLRMDYLRPSTAKSHGDDRLRIAGTKGIVEYQAATGITVVSSASSPRKLQQLPPPGSLFIDFLRSVYLGGAPSLTLDDIFRVNEITIAAQRSAEEHRLVAC